MYQLWTESQLWLRSCTEERGRGQAPARSSAVAQSAPLAAWCSSLEVVHPQSPCCHRPSDQSPGTFRAQARRPSVPVTVESQMRWSSEELHLHS